MRIFNGTARPRGLLKTGWEWFQSRRRSQSRAGRLRVAELVSLGDKRLVAVVELDGRQFLIGCGPASVSLLAQLGPRTSECAAAEASAGFSEVFNQALTANGASA
jgi:flagellar biogenesis protein FliO